MKHLRDWIVKIYEEKAVENLENLGRLSLQGLRRPSPTTNLHRRVWYAARGFHFLLLLSSNYIIYYYCTTKKACKLVVHRSCSRLEIRESVLLLIVLCHIALRELSMNSDDRINRGLKILESDASLFIIGFPPRGNLFFLSLLLPSLLLRVSRYRVGWKKFCFQR